MKRIIDKKEFEPDKEYIRRLLFEFAAAVKMDIHFIRHPQTGQHRYLQETFVGIIQDKVDDWESIIGYMKLNGPEDVQKARTKIITQRANIELVRI